MVMDLFASALWFILPAYVANAAAPVFGGGVALDLKRNFGKYRLLGDGKTFKGTFFGMLFGFLFGVLQAYFQNVYSLGFQIPMTYGLAFLLSFGAMSGDIMGAFMKRRMGLVRGAPAPFLDQLDFIFGAVLLSSLAVRHDIYTVLFLVVITPPIHLLANKIGYIIKVKKTPW